MKEKNNKKLNFLIRFFRSFGRLGLKNEIYFFIENLSMLLEAGMDISAALNSLSQESSSGRMKKIIEKIKNNVELGESLASSIAKEKILPDHMLAFIRLGEKSGKLVENLKILVIQNDKEVAFRSKTKSALIYAVVIFVLTTVVAAGTGWYTLPRIAEVYSQINAELPFLTKVVIGFGNFLGQYGYIFIPLIFLLFASAFYFLFSFPKTKFIGHIFLMKIPVIKNLIQHVEIARFSYLLGNMLDAGLPISETLEAAPGITTFNNYKRFYQYLGQQVNKGESIQKSFLAYKNINKLFSSSSLQMLMAAEKSGSLPQTLLRLGQMHEKKADNLANNLPVLLEPIILLIVGIGVALFVLATILPIYNFTKVI